MTIRQLTDFVIESVNLNSPPRTIESIIYEKLRETLPEIVATEKAAEFSPKIFARLGQIHKRAVEQREDTKFVFNSSSPYFIQGPYFDEPRDPEVIKTAKLARAQASQILTALHSLTFTEFECLCASVLKELGASQVVRTPHSEDQGIDFYGKLNLGQLVPDFPFLRLEDSISVWLIGQAKHYPSRSVKVSDVRELAGSILLARHQEYTVKDIYPDLRARSCDPVLGLFITSGTFTRGSHLIGAASGIVCKDGTQLSNFLADRRCGFIQESKGLVFSEREFRKWLEMSNKE